MEHAIKTRLKWYDDNGGSTEAARALFQKQAETMAERKKLPPVFPAGELNSMRYRLQEGAKTMSVEDLESLAQEIAEAEAQTETHREQNEALTQEINKLNARVIAAMDQVAWGIWENCRKAIAAILQKREAVYSRVPAAIPDRVRVLYFLARDASERLSPQVSGNGMIRRIPSVFEGLSPELEAAGKARVETGQGFTAPARATRIVA